MPVFLQYAAAICQNIESGDIELTGVPYVDPETNYLISKLDEHKYNIVEWYDCTPNNLQDWFAFRPAGSDTCTLYLKNKHSMNVYFITN